MENFRHTSWVHRPLFWDPLLNTFLELLHGVVGLYGCGQPLSNFLPSFSLHLSHHSFLICPLPSVGTSFVSGCRLLCPDLFLSFTSPLNSMTITFSDLHVEAGLKSLEKFLFGKAYIVGDHLKKDDVKVYAAVPKKPESHFPNASKWYCCVSSHLAKSFTGKAIGVRVGCHAAPIEAVPKEVKEAAPVGDDDDDLNLFGDETEKEKKAAEEREAAVKASSKKKESGKSSVILDMKPWDGNTCLEESDEEHGFFRLMCPGYYALWLIKTMSMSI
ncbi:hypothetical protein PVL29_022935 [Vitis rotundifolia]|uniref:Translation elongation factor EF1B beta/delta subunit guanine nucleotide exchange domain-containing protein n=1 Tax=Vitis rotundifolia TaxID=103349 RepID=A0AA38YX94_VITRO|nr:hypothetical protein PVL29_022935 [Vitis rotundifolia]